jgi:serine/threonine-protein kinase
MPRFGTFDVDFAIAELRKSGVRVRIQEQPLRILQRLLDRPGELVTREELHDLLWPSGTFVDFERSLNAAVGKLRQTLRDSADHPIYVETVARRGYRFIAPVIDFNPQPTPAEPQRPRRLYWWALAGGLAAAFALLCWAAWPRWRGEPERRLVRLDLDVGKDVSQPSISPDGQTLAFIVMGRLAVRRLEDATITPLAGTDGASSPFFSPDGKWIGYFAEHKLRKVPAVGGEPVTLCEAAVDRGATWTEDGQIVAALSASGELSSVPASGGTPRPFSNFKSDLPEITDHRRPVALPGGRGILFISGSGAATGSLRVLPKGGDRARTLVEGSSTARYLASGHLLYNRGNTIYAAPLDLNRLEFTSPELPLVDRVAYNHFLGADFDVSASGTLVYRTVPPAANLVAMWLGPSGTEGLVLPKAGDYVTPRLSPDGRRLALTSEFKVWIYDLGRETMTRLTFGSEAQCCPVWSPDGEYVAFGSFAAGGSQEQDALAWTRWDGVGTVGRLPSARGTTAVPFSFSPDGKWLAFHRNAPQTGYDLWAAGVDRAGGVMRLGPPQALLRQAGLQAAPTISPDGQWLAYGSDDETGRMEVYVIPFSPQGSPQAGKRQISTDGGVGARWSPDGGEIFFRSPADYLMAATVSAKGGSFQSDKPRVWSTKRLAATSPFMNFDVAPGKHVLALFEAQAAEPDKTHLRVLLNVNEQLRRLRDGRRKP